MIIRTKDEQCLSSSKGQNVKERKKNCSGLGFDFLEREGVASLYDLSRSDRRISSGQEGKLLYAARATRGHQFLGVSTNSMR